MHKVNTQFPILPLPNCSAGHHVGCKFNKGDAVGTDFLDNIHTDGSKCPACQMFFLFFPLSLLEHFLFNIKVSAEINSQWQCLFAWPSAGYDPVTSRYLWKMPRIQHWSKSWDDHDVGEGNQSQSFSCALVPTHWREGSRIRLNDVSMQLQKSLPGLVIEQ